MAIYYSRLSIVSRGRGESSVAAAAYRAGLRLQDQRTGVVHDYRQRRGVLHSSMVAPEGMAWACDPGEVWNRAEKIERRSNARTARELVVALPSELPQAEASRLAQQIGRDLVAAYGVVVQIAVHAPDRRGDERNVHAHLLMTTRAVHAGGLGAKVRVLDDRRTGPIEARKIRARVAARVNSALQNHGATDRVDPRPLHVQAKAAAERGDLDSMLRLARLPQRHQGRAATAAARRGQHSPTVKTNAGIRRYNRMTMSYGLARARNLRAMPVVPSSLRALQEVAAQQRRQLADYQRAVNAGTVVLNRVAQGWAEHRAERTTRALATPTSTTLPPLPSPELKATTGPAAPMPEPERGLSRRQWAEHRRRQRAQANGSVLVAPETRKVRP